MAKHYIRIDENNKVIYGYSDSFEKSLSTDICINEDGARQFELLGEVNPILLDSRGCHRFIYDSKTTSTEIEIVEDASDEVVVTEDIDTSGVKLDDEEATLEDVDVKVEKIVTATAKGKKIVTETKYFVRYATEEELEEEYSTFPTPIPTPTEAEQIEELQEKVSILEETNEMLVECLLEMSEIVYGME